jgi:DDE family transposase
MIEVVELLKQLPHDGAVVTGDAAFTFRPIIEAIRERGGDYFLFVKANQPELEGEIARAFERSFPVENLATSKL